VIVAKGSPDLQATVFKLHTSTETTVAFVCNFGDRLLWTSNRHMLREDARSKE
jgi:hypothetical protein